MGQCSLTVALPNITEACFLAGMEYRTEYDRAYIDLLLEKLTAIGCKNIVLTGFSYAPRQNRHRGL